MKNYSSATLAVFKPLMSKFDKLPVQVQKKVNHLIRSLDQSLNRHMQRYYNSEPKQTTEAKQKRNGMERARRAKAPVKISFSKREVAERDGWSCYLCGVLLDETTATVDHVVPLSRGGWHCLENAKLACKSCNEDKADRTLDEYLNC